MIESQPLCSSAGWLAPDGRWFPCKYHEHDILGFYIAKQEKFRYYDLSEHNWIRIYENGEIYLGYNAELRPTQTQLNVLDLLISVFTGDASKTLERRLKSLLEKLNENL